ncbi:MAG: hypothetical protein QOK40_3451 [Miltoncostaeaceae bacterium]|jgi:hypothetical protein|nr:hypothetical protein [Miltoncostaeaceae bacterium]
MAVGVIWHPDVDRQTYDAIKEQLFQPSVDKGLRFHAAGEADGGFRIIEVWESREGLERFIREDLTPLFERTSGGRGPTPEPESVFEVHFQGP